MIWRVFLEEKHSFKIWGRDVGRVVGTITWLQECEKISWRVRE